MPKSDIRRWSADDNSRLRELARRYPLANIAALLGRSPSATAAKAHKLKRSLRFKPIVNEPNSPGIDPGPAGFDWQDL
jgi:hypothetical protein